MLDRFGYFIVRASRIGVFGSEDLGCYREARLDDHENELKF